MKEKIGQLVKDHANGNLSAFSRQSGVPYGTLYDIVNGNANIDKVGIGHFMKIARCLGMTADELYYGVAPEPPTYPDHRQVVLNDCFDTLNDKGRERLVDEAEMLANNRKFAKSEDHRVSKTA